MVGKIRITGGEWRGRKLSVPERDGLRPTGDRAREVLFNWLQGRVRGARCLDLFAGTGALGLEAASRGAASVQLVEQDRRLADRLREIAAEWPGGKVLTVACEDALTWLSRSTGPFDLVFVDPPFEDRLYGRVLDELGREDRLAADGRVYLESPARSPAPVSADGDPCRVASSPCMQADLQPGWSPVREKIVGEVRLQLVRLESAESL